MRKLFIFIILLALIPHPAHAAWKWIGGAELNTITDGVEVTTNSAPIATTTTAHSGSLAWRVNAGAGFQREVIYTANQAATGTIRVWYYPVARPNATTQFIRFSNAANTSVGNISMLTDGTLVLLTSAGAQLGSASTVLPLNQWSCVELRTDSSVAAGKLEGRLNGVQFAIGANSNQGSWARALWGNVTGAQTTNDGYFDDVAVVDGSTNYAGCGSTVFMKPNAAGDSASWTIGGTSVQATNWGSVLTATTTDGTTLVKSKTVNQEDLYNFTDSGLHSYDTINALTVNVRYANDTADITTAFKVEYETAASGLKQPTAAFLPNSVTWSSYGTQAAKADSANFSTTTGQTGAALTSTDLDSGQAGYILSAGSTNFVQVDVLWEYADYTAGVAPATTASSFGIVTFFGW